MFRMYLQADEKDYKSKKETVTKVLYFKNLTDLIKGITSDAILLFPYYKSAEFKRFNLSEIGCPAYDKTNLESNIVLEYEDEDLGVMKMFIDIDFA